LPSGFSDYCPAQIAYTDTVPTTNPALTVWNHTAVTPDNPSGNGRGLSANQVVQPLVEPNGTVDVSYVIEECNTGLDHQLRFQKSTDGGASFRPQSIRIDKHGEFVDNPDPNDLLPDKKFRVPLSPTLAYNSKTGTLAYVYQNNRDAATSGANISVSLSHDGGLTWSSMKYVSLHDQAPAENDQ